MYKRTCVQYVLNLLRSPLNISGSLILIIGFKVNSPVTVIVAGVAYPAAPAILPVTDTVSSSALPLSLLPDIVINRPISPYTL
jgi:hypothetical protein